MSPIKKKIIIVLVAVVIAFVIGIILYGWLGHGAGTSGSAGSASTSGSSAMAGTPTHAAVPAGSVAPNQGAAASAGVAVPVIQGPGNPAGTVDYRSFNIAIQGGAFSPSTVIVNQGDTVDLEMTAVDGNYTFTQPDYGFNAAIKKGKTQRIQFQAVQSGDFTFYCSSCGGPSTGPIGHIVVVATTQ